MTVPPMLRAPSPRYDIEYLGRQFGLAFAVKYQRHASFAWEILLVVGPFAFTLNLKRRRRP